jgi:parallel beta-helix repeat protein
MKQKILTSLCLIFLYAFNSYATSVSGNVFGHWTIANSPYHVVNNLTIPSDSTLIIDAGVEVIFDANYELKVDGRILAVGTVSDSIKFAATAVVPGFAGIRLEVTNAQQDSSIFEYCIVQYANRGNQFLTSMDNYGGGIMINNFNKVRIQHCTINNCRAFDAGAGIMLYSASSIYILDNDISFNEVLNASSNVTTGAGIYCRLASNAIISRNNIHHNKAGTRGGAIYSVSSQPIISENNIRYNYSYPLYITGNGDATILSNNIEYNNLSPAGTGPAVYAVNTGNILIQNNNISNNKNYDYSGTLKGGGIYVANAANILIKNNTINKNSVSVSSSTSLLGGGGIYCNSTANALIVGNSICNNQTLSNSDGGGVYVKNATLINNIICNNMCGGYPLAGRGGGVYAQDTIVLINNTIANNHARIGGGVYINGHRNSKMFNCIVWGNYVSSYGNGKQVYCNNGLTTLNYTIKNCDIDSGQAGIGLLNNNLQGMTYQNNIDTIPYFINPTDTAWPSADATLADWSLLGSSACINAGDSSYITESFDIIGNTRIYDSTVDMGAYEYQSMLVSQVTANFNLPFDSTCLANSVTLNNLSTNASNYIWSFEDGNPASSILQNPTVNFTSAGVKTITLIAYNSTDTSTFTQNILINSAPTAATISSTDALTFCEGTSITLSGNNAGVWSNGSTQTDLVVSTAGDYYVTTSNSCGSITSNILSVTVLPLPVAPTIHAMGSTNICAGTSVMIMGNVSGIWNTGASTSTIQANQTGTYNVMVSSACGTAYSNDVNINVTDLPVASIISAIGNTDICAGDSVLLIGNDNNGLWSDGSSQASIYVTETDSYQIINSNQCGVASSNIINVNVNALPDTTVSGINNTLLANLAGAGYQWFDCISNSILSNETSQQFIAGADGVYAVIITSNNCIDTSACYAIQILGLESNVKNESGFSVYPNPSSDWVNLTGVEHQNISIQNALGELVFTKTNCKNLEMIPVHSFAKGLYLIKSSDGKNMKLVVE